MGKGNQPIEIVVLAGYDGEFIYAKGHHSKRRFSQAALRHEDFPSIGASRVRRLMKYIAKGYLRYRPALPHERGDFDGFYDIAVDGQRGAFKATYWSLP